MPDFLTGYFDKLTSNILTTLETPEDYFNKIALTAVIIALSFLLRFLLRKFVVNNENDFVRRFQLQKIVKRIMITLTVIAVLFIWIQAINALILISLLVGVLGVIMVRGLTNNIIGYVVIRSRKYFKIGHRIELNGVIGDVIEINPVSFELLEVRNWLSSDAITGRVIKFPNKVIFDASIEIVGVTNVFVWHEIKYVLSFDSDWHDAERIMTEAGNEYFADTVLPAMKDEHGKLPGDKEEMDPEFSLNTNEDGIVLILRYLVDYRNATGVKTRLQRQMLAEIEQNPDIQFATFDIRILE